MTTKNQENMTTKNQDTTGFDNDIQQIQANLSIVREQAKELEKAVESMEERVRIARGTGDISDQATQAMQATETIPPQPEPEPASPRVKVEAAIRQESLGVNQIARATGETLNRVTDVIKALRTERKVYNVGSEDYPIWTLRIGDETPTKELNRHVRRLVTERPMGLRELVEATGARLSRVSGAVVHLQRTEAQLLNLGGPRSARWFLVSAKSKPSGLTPKGRPIQDA